MTPPLASRAPSNSGKLDAPITYAPPGIQTSTGKPAPGAGSGDQTLSVSQSSLEGSCPEASIPNAGCGGCGPNAYAGRTPAQALTSRGAPKRSAPTGGSAYEMPRKTARPASIRPRNTPAAVRISGSNPGSGDVAAVT